MRSAAELITELEDEATQHSYVAILVGFEESTILVHPDDSDRLKTLDDAVSVGGTPIGLVAADLVGNEMKILTRVYPERNAETDDCDYEQYMADFAGLAGQRILEQISQGGWPGDQPSGG